MNQLPLITQDVFKYGYGAGALFLGIADKDNPSFILLWEIGVFNY